MYTLDFKGNIIKLKLTQLIHNTLKEDEIIQVMIEYEGRKKTFSGIIQYKNAKYIYVELLDELVKIDNVSFIQKL